MEKNDLILGGMTVAKTGHFEIISSLALSLFGEMTEEEIFWHTAKNTISKLGLDDFVVYLYDEVRSVLVQKAALGNKVDGGSEIIDPIEIRLGEGVVGECASKKIPILVNDTRQYPGYLIDDEERLSELAVPLIYEGELIGVLDSEHSEANFYKDQHVQLFSTISYMVSSKVAANRSLRNLEMKLENLSDKREKLKLSLRKHKVLADEAKMSSKVKSEMFDNLNHEIRTPLTSIVGFAEMLEDKIVDDDGKLLLDMLQNSTQRLLDTISSVLDYSRLDSQRTDFDFEWIDFGEEVKEIVDLLTANATEKNLYLKVETFDKAHLNGSMDKRALYRIINNVVGNAIKFTDQGGVLISVTGTNEHISIDVTDTGIGMGANFVPKVFELWQRQSNGDGSPSGSGLGLSITKKIIENLGGEISVESRPNVGSTFMITIPKYQGMSV